MLAFAFIAFIATPVLSLVSVEDTGAALRGFVCTMPLGADSLGDSRIRTQYSLTITPHLLDK